LTPAPPGSRRIALFGGTFDPVHEAHLVVARAAADRFALDQVLFIPAAHPPHKSGVTSAGYEDRFRMVELACAADPRFCASRLEAGETKSYSILTIGKVKARLSAGDEMFFLIGSDAFAEIDTWYRYEEVIATVQFIVVTRPGHDFGMPQGARVHLLDSVALPVSSSRVREELSTGRLPAELPGEVADYIASKGLYGYRAPAHHR
jgi:nicotinate-nucleotide adenylyltransferase